MCVAPNFARRRAAIAAIAVAIATSSAACLGPPRDQGTFAVPSDHAARTRAEALLTGAVARDVAALRAGLCAPLASRTAELLEPGQALAIEGFEVTRVEAVWVGGEPAFYVAAELVRQGARLPRGLRVRAREGCVDQLLDSAPVGAAAPDPDEISL